MGSPYQSQSASGYNSSPPADDGSTTASNKITWAKIKSALADSVKTLADSINTQLRAALNVSPSTTSSPYTTLVGDHLTTIEVTGTTTISLGDATTMTAQSMGYTVTVLNRGTALVTVGLATAGNTLNGVANGTVTLTPWSSATFTVNQGITGYEVVGGSGSIPAQFSFGSIIAPAQITGDQNDYSPTNLVIAGILQLNTDAARSLTGLATGTSGRTITLQNTGSFDIILKNENGSSTATNRFNLNASLDYTLKPRNSLVIQYDATAGRWRVAVTHGRYDAIASGRNIAARTNSGTPNTKIDITADEIVLRDANGNTFTAQTVSGTIDFGTTGANGLDTSTQAASTWYYGWVIAKADGTVALLGSLSSTAPTMPTGYTFKALVTAAFSDGSTHFILYRQKGNWCFFESFRQVLTAGSASTETSITINTSVPPNALSFQAALYGTFNAGAGGTASSTVSLRPITGGDFLKTQFAAIANGAGGFGTCGQIPNINQTLFYLFTPTTNVSSIGINVDILGFKLPLGGE